MTLAETGTTHPWRRNRKTAILLAVFLGAWTWIYTYRRDAWKATLGLALQFSTIFITVLVWIALRDYFGFISRTAGNITNEQIDQVFSLFMTIFIVFGSIIFAGIQIWAIADAAKAKGWELAEPKGRNKTAAILFAIFTSYMTWLYTYPKDVKKFWLGLAFASVFPLVSYLTWFDPYEIIGTQVIPQDYQLKSFLISLPGMAFWIIGIVLAAVRKSEWYKQGGQSSNPEVV